MRKATALLCLGLLLLQGAFALEDTQWIRIPEDFAAGEWETGPYTAGYVRGGSEADIAALASGLLGPDYIENENGTLLEAKDGEIWEIRRMDVDSETGEISYWDPLVSSERGAEYEPPMMNMLPEESVLILKGLLSQYFTNGETDRVGKARLIQERWSYADRWMTDEEYRKYMYDRDLHYFNFEHVSPSGLSILGDSISASVGVNGLNGFDLTWHNFKGSSESIAPISLEKAVSMANSTRLAKATLLYADLVYSNWVTENEEYNLSWYLVTDQGSYVVDCVELKHKCDSYEY